MGVKEPGKGAGPGPKLQANSTPGPGQSGPPTSSGKAPGNRVGGGGGGGRSQAGRPAESGALGLTLAPPSGVTPWPGRLPDSAPASSPGRGRRPQAKRRKI